MKDSCSALAAEDWTEKQLQQIISRITYKPDWRFHIRLNHDAIQFHIEAPFIDRDSRSSVLVQSQCDWQKAHIQSEKDLVCACLNAVVSLEVHEAQEAFRYWGERVFDPHAGEQSDLSQADVEALRWDAGANARAIIKTIQGRRAICCLICGTTSSNRYDIEQGFCVGCERFFDELPPWTASK